MKVYKIKKNFDFRIVYNRGKSYSSKLFILYIYKNKKNLEINRLGISISKKVGKSVLRNKIRRYVYEIYRLNLYKLKTGYDIVFIVRVAAKDKNYSEVEKSINKLFNKSLMLL
ncbi:ribonuclease P protein component [Candidatus Arthromitus sp. SFB-rat-Yit]|uniref:ribonuclease P protein component n=1 Tax=Candidatus Arthromitus sp. SFB-rat-Yit TaxID=1041504 RepID=UPI000227A85C|nr:ribonuclease P protein component [Candidatus Arthromitus sp. SFB-rat-Yit]BAK81907.1 ribonuclease P [Candidatus Arthromitus sp. SFB-rat-Yit]